MDQMIAEIFSEETRRGRKRGFCTDRATAFAATYDELVYRWMRLLAGQGTWFPRKER